jgi:hypothetical protein
MARYSWDLDGNHASKIRDNNPPTMATPNGGRDTQGIITMPRDPNLFNIAHFKRRSAGHVADSSPDECPFLEADRPTFCGIVRF